MSAQPLSGKQVLITGASAGIGRACAVLLARAGAKVIATGRRENELARLRAEVPLRTIAGDLNDAAFAVVGVLPDDYRAITGWRGPALYVPVSDRTLPPIER